MCLSVDKRLSTLQLSYNLVIIFPEPDHPQRTCEESHHPVFGTASFIHLFLQYLSDGSVPGMGTGDEGMDGLDPLLQLTQMITSAQC